MKFAVFLSLCLFFATAEDDKALFGKGMSNAEAKWKDSQKKMDDLLNKVRSQMSTFDTKLDKTSADAKQQLVLLEKNRNKESKDIEKSQEQLQRLSSHSAAVAAPSPVSSFLQTDKLDAGQLFKQALQKASVLANKVEEETTAIRNQLKGLGLSDDKKPSSFFETGQPKTISEIVNSEIDNEQKVEQAMGATREALSHTESGVKRHSAELSRKQMELAEKHDKNQMGDNVGASFLQESEKKNELGGFVTPVDIEGWKRDFETRLQKAREAAGLPSKISSFMQSDGNDGNTKQSGGDAKDEEFGIDKKQEDAFKAKIAELEKKNRDIIAESKSALEKYKKDRQKTRASFLENSRSPVIHNKFNLEKEQANLASLVKKWHMDAEKLKRPSGDVETATHEIQGMIDVEKPKEQALRAERQRLTDKMKKEMQVIKEDTADVREEQAKLSAKSSFIQTDEKKYDISEKDKAAIEKVMNDLKNLHLTKE